MWTAYGGPLSWAAPFALAAQVLRSADICDSDQARTLTTLPKCIQVTLLRLQDLWIQKIIISGVIIPAFRLAREVRYKNSTQVVSALAGYLAYAMITAGHLPLVTPLLWMGVLITTFLAAVSWHDGCLQPNLEEQSVMSIMALPQAVPWGECTPERSFAKILVLPEWTSPEILTPWNSHDNSHEVPTSCKTGISHMGVWSIKAKLKKRFSKEKALVSDSAWSSLSTRTTKSSKRGGKCWIRPHSGKGEQTSMLLHPPSTAAQSMKEARGWTKVCQNFRASSRGASHSSTHGFLWGEVRHEVSIFQGLLALVTLVGKWPVKFWSLFFCFLSLFV